MLSKKLWRHLRDRQLGGFKFRRQLAVGRYVVDFCCAEAKLIVVGGKASKRDVALELPTTIGRSRQADLTVAHAMVSRQHCELFEEDVCDLDVDVR